MSRTRKPPSAAAAIIRRSRAATAARPTFQPRPPASPLRRWFRAAALSGIALIIVIADTAAFVESYRGLYEYAKGHGLSGRWAAFWPLQIDAFIIVGELTLFVAIVDRFDRRGKALAWVATIGGTVVSVLGNIGHIAETAPTLWRYTAAVPPIAATAGLMIGLGVLKRILHVVGNDPVPVTIVTTTKPLNWSLSPLTVGLVAPSRPTPGGASGSLTVAGVGRSVELTPGHVSVNGVKAGIDPAAAAIAAFERELESAGMTGDSGTPLDRVAPKRSPRTGGDPRVNPRYAEGLRRVHDLVESGGSIPTGRWLATEMNYSNRVIPNLVISDYKNGARPT